LRLKSFSTHPWLLTAKVVPSLGSAGNEVGLALVGELVVGLAVVGGVNVGAPVVGLAKVGTSVGPAVVGAGVGDAVLGVAVVGITVVGRIVVGVAEVGDVVQRGSPLRLPLLLLLLPALLQLSLDPFDLLVETLWSDPLAIDPLDPLFERLLLCRERRERWL
jgi:hypothetical protein